MRELAALLIAVAVVVGLVVLRGARGSRTRGGVHARRTGTRRSPLPELDPDAPVHEQLRQIRRDGRFWGVMLRYPSGQGCALVQARRETRYELDRAPKLPLPGCDSPQCRCSYLPLRERRQRDVLPPDGDERRGSGKVRWDVYKS